MFTDAFLLAAGPSQLGSFVQLAPGASHPTRRNWLCLYHGLPTGYRQLTTGNELALFRTIGPWIPGGPPPIGFVCSWRYRSTLPGPPNWVCSYNWPMGPAARPVEIGFVCTPRPRDSNAASGRSQTVSEPRIARSKAWNSHSIGVISAIRCLTKPEDKMSRPCGPEVPAGSAAVTEGHGGPSASAVRPPMRHL